MKKLASKFTKSMPQSITTKPVKQEESTDMAINRLISVSRIKRRGKIA